MKILLPVDGSEYTKRALGYLAAREDDFGRDNDYLVYTVVAPLPMYATRFLEGATVEGYYRDEAAAVLDPIRAFAAQRGWRAEFEYTHGHAAVAVAAIAESWKADLILMGTHGHTAFGNVLLGSVANGVLARSKVAVLLIR